MDVKDKDPVSELAIAMTQGALDGARNRQPQSAQVLLSWICESLRKYRALSPEWADFIAEALEKAVENPKRAGVALGLIGKRQRPRTYGKWRRDDELAAKVRALQLQGMPLKDGRRGNGAFTHVANESHVGKRTVERAWKDKIAFIRRYAKALAAAEGQ